MYEFTLFTATHDVNKMFRYPLPPLGRVPNPLPRQPVGVKPLLMGKGAAETIRCQAMSEFAAFLPTLTSQQFTAYGVCGRESAGVVTIPEHARLGRPADPIPRSAEFFKFGPGPGIMALDYDVWPGCEPFSFEEILSRLFAVAPELRIAPMMLWHSSSTFIYAESGEQYCGDGGKRIYIGLAEAEDIPRLGEVLFRKLIGGGCHAYRLSKDGDVLPRTIVDKMLFLPTQPDFCGHGAICAWGLCQRRPAPELLNPSAPPFDSKTIRLTAEEQKAFDEVDRAEKAALKPEVQKILQKQRDRPQAATTNRPATTNRSEIDQPEPGQPLKRSTPIYVKQLADGRRIDQEFTVADLMKQDKFSKALVVDPFNPSRDALLFNRNRKPGIWRIKTRAHVFFEPAIPTPGTANQAEEDPNLPIVVRP